MSNNAVYSFLIVYSNLGLTMLLMTEKLLRNKKVKFAKNTANTDNV